VSFILGLDPGLANLGWAVFELLEHSDRVVEVGVFRTEKSHVKRHMLASDDNVRRARESASKLIDILNRYTVMAICAESMSFPRSASAAAKMAMCWGSVATLSEQKNLSVIQASPQEVKKIVCGSKAASKEDVEEAVKRRYPDVESMLGNVSASYREHAYDAVAVVMASMQLSEVIRAIRPRAA
jgi:Holliday junction resolvasome RuvABC endonuclease subunit